MSNYAFYLDFRESIVPLGTPLSRPVARIWFANGLQATPPVPPTRAGTKTRVRREAASGGSSGARRTTVTTA